MGDDDAGAKTPMWLRWLGTYARFMEWRANRRRDQIRTAQAETGRTFERVTKFRVYSQDCRYRRDPDFRQSVVSLVYQFTASGEVRRLPPDTHEDVMIVTDIPTLHGIASGSFRYHGADGREIVRSPFGPKEAILLGRLESNGDFDMMLEVKTLLAKLPDVDNILRMPSPAETPAVREVLLPS